mmetsp:Transcript_36655/g.74708  ORF Transcript_36655/g.74708 Transcript_36655/m.74708 type:complete len:118 (-) Transcript_36655:1653-2006(-)
MFWPHRQLALLAAVPEATTIATPLGRCASLVGTIRVSARFRFEIARLTLEIQSLPVMPHWHTRLAKGIVALLAGGDKVFTITSIHGKRSIDAATATGLRASSAFNEASRTQAVPLTF